LATDTAGIRTGQAFPANICPFLLTKQEAIQFEENENDAEFNQQRGHAPNPRTARRIALRSTLINGSRESSRPGMGCIAE
jgi:hypothetical protein